MVRQMLRFGTVGALATLVHMVIGSILIQSGFAPLTANLIAFMIAFSISFIGHLGYSFADQQNSVSTALWKFGIVGVIGFACNEAILICLLHLTQISDTGCLLSSTVCAAALTFSLSRTWAFRAAPKTAYKVV